MITQISKNFFLNEFTDSITAKNRKIDNTPSHEEVVNITLLVQNTLQPIRDKFGKSIFVNSGFRSPRLNAAVGGANSSQHLTGQAADITAGNPDENRKLFNMIKASDIPFDQLIDEYNCQWVHVSYSKDRNRRQVLYIK